MGRSRITAVCLLLLAGLFPVSPAAGQQSSPPQQQETPREWGVWGAGSFNTLSLGGLSSSDVEGRNLLIGAFRYGRILTRGKNITFSYTIDLIPVAIAFHSQTQPVSTSSTVYARENVYGFGASPVGFKFNFLTNHAVQPFFALTGGFLYFQEPVPNPVGTHWNFTATAGGGLQFSVGDHRAITLGYLFHHISNARPQKENPSLNTNLIYFGFSFFRTPHNRD